MDKVGGGVSLASCRFGVGGCSFSSSSSSRALEVGAIVVDLCLFVDDEEEEPTTLRFFLVGATILSTTTTGVRG